MRKILAISACVLPFIMAPVAYGQTSQAPATPGTTAPMPGAPGTPLSPAAPGQAGAPGAPMRAAPGNPTTSANTPAPSEATKTVSGWSVKHKIMGEAVYNGQNVKIGDIDDVVLAPDGKSATFVVGAGGFLGMGAHDVAIPFDKIKKENDKFVLEGYTKAQLKALPEVKVEKK